MIGHERKGVEVDVDEADRRHEHTGINQHRGQRATADSLPARTQRIIGNAIAAAGNSHCHHAAGSIAHADKRRAWDRARRVCPHRTRKPGPRPESRSTGVSANSCALAPTWFRSSHSVTHPETMARTNNGMVGRMSCFVSRPRCHQAITRITAGSVTTAVFDNSAAANRISDAEYHARLGGCCS